MTPPQLSAPLDVDSSLVVLATGVTSGEGLGEEVTEGAGDSEDTGVGDGVESFGVGAGVGDGSGEELGEGTGLGDGETVGLELASGDAVGLGLSAAAAVTKLNWPTTINVANIPEKSFLFIIFNYLSTINCLIC